MLRYKDILLCLARHLMRQYELLGSCYEVNNISRPSPSATFVSVEQFGIVGCSSQYLALWWADCLLLHPPTRVFLFFFPFLPSEITQKAIMEIRVRYIEQRLMGACLVSEWRWRTCSEQVALNPRYIISCYSWFVTENCEIMVIKYIEYIQWIYLLRDGNKTVLFCGNCTEFLH
jgi:hypothetical protein